MTCRPFESPVHPGGAEDKVLVLPGAGFEMPGYFRISLTGTEAMFDRALPVLERAIEEATD